MACTDARPGARKRADSDEPPEPRAYASAQRNFCWRSSAGAKADATGARRRGFGLIAHLRRIPAAEPASGRLQARASARRQRCDATCLVAAAVDPPPGHPARRAGGTGGRRIDRGDRVAVLARHRAGISKIAHSCGPCPPVHRAAATGLGTWDSCLGDHGLAVAVGRRQASTSAAGGELRRDAGPRVGAGDDLQRRAAAVSTAAGDGVGLGRRWPAKPASHGIRCGLMPRPVSQRTSIARCRGWPDDLPGTAG